MRKVIFALLFLATPAFAGGVDFNTLVDQTNFLVNDNCSGTLIGKPADGYVLTAAHCVRDQFEDVERDTIKDDGTVKKEKVRVAKPGTVTQIKYTGPMEASRNVYVFKLIDIDRDFDLALLKVQTQLTNATAASVACSEPSRLDTVYAVGNSFGVLYTTVTSGTVSSLHRSYRDLKISGQLGDATDLGEHGLVQHTAPIAGGNSGGALYNADWRLIGVNVRGIQGGFGFAVPLEDMRTFLTKNKLETCK